MTKLTPKSNAEIKHGVTGLTGEMAAKIGGQAARKEFNRNKKAEEDEAKALRERILAKKAEDVSDRKRKEQEDRTQKHEAKNKKQIDLQNAAEEARKADEERIEADKLAKIRAKNEKRQEKRKAKRAEAAQEGPKTETVENVVEG